jgi:hypothetical protein
MSFDNMHMGDMDRDLQYREQIPRGWWKRNWMWFVPTSFLCMIIFCCGCPAAMFVGVVGIMRNSEPYLIAMEKIQANPEAQEALGQPIRDNSWMPIGEINQDITSGTGNTELRWNLAGPKGEGKAYVKARMADGKWEIVMIEVNLPNGKKIVLHDKGGGNDAPPFPAQDNAEPGKAKEVEPPDMNITTPDKGESKK